ncbi:MAG: serine hydrolase [Alistipes finegoldii]
MAELLAYSVAQSDNNVCDLLFRFLGGPEVVNCYIAGLGVGETGDRGRRGDHAPPYGQPVSQLTTPLAAVRLLELFRRGKLLSAEPGIFCAEDDVRHGDRLRQTPGPAASPASPWRTRPAALSAMRRA